MTQIEFVTELEQALHGNVEERIIQEKKEDDVEMVLDLLMIAKYLERIGDHAENVAEWVVYLLTGEHV